MQTYLLLFVAMAAIFYLLILRPQQRAKRAKAEMAAALEPGSEILTVGGIYGTVVELREADFDLEIAEGVIMKMDRRAIASVIRDTEDDVADDADDDDAPVDEDHEDDGTIVGDADEADGGSADDAKS